MQQNRDDNDVERIAKRAADTKGEPFPEQRGSG